MTAARWFETQHVQQGCNTAMGNMDKYTKHCKDLNTFLHEASPVWPLMKFWGDRGTPTVACKKGCENCHLSQGPVSLTTCELTSGKYPDCSRDQSRALVTPSGQRVHSQ
ncbi:ribonuclease 8-like [Acinonyx jubatus]|uniref:Ribonuclease 8-like n=1 Tax=Acinonyx jubatus TaxID=32536 RepID=A0ABM3QAW5_ACIJB|nr:ribonuclease 8-like [Acinonyx jubatus]